MTILCSLLVGLACQGQDRPSVEGPAIRPTIAEAQVWLAKPVEEWMAMLGTADAATRRARVGMYVGYGNAKLVRLRPVFVRALGDPDLRVRLAAAGVLMMNQGFAQAESDRAANLLGEALADRKTRPGAIYALQIDPDKSIPALSRLARVIGQIEDEQDEWRFVTEIFLRLGDRASPAVGELIDALKSGDGRSKARAATLLASIGEPAKSAIPELLVAIRYADRDVAFASYEAIRRIDPNSQPKPSPVTPFIPAEVAILGGTDLRAGFFAAERLSRVGPEAIGELPALLRYLDRFEKESDDGDMAGLFLAGWLGRPRFGDGFIPALTTLIRDHRPDESRLACLLIANGREGYADAIPAMLAKLAATSGEVKGEVAAALGSIARLDPKVVPVLIQALQDPDPMARRGAVEGLGFQQQFTPEALAAAEKAKDDPDLGVRKKAAGAISSLRVQQDLEQYKKPRPK